MQLGYNTDLNYKGKLYHIQTEDWGEGNPYIVSQVFFQGAIVKTIKIPYSEALLHGPANKTKDSIQLALRIQHHQLMDDLLSGRIL